MSSAGLGSGGGRISGDFVGQFSSNLWSCLVQWLGDVLRMIARGEAHAGVR